MKEEKHKKKAIRFFQNLKKPETPFMIIGVIIVGVILILEIFIPSQSKSVSENKSSEMAAKIENIEKIIEQITAISEKVSSLEQKIKKFSETAETFEKFEATTSIKLEYLTKDVTALKEKQISNNNNNNNNNIVTHTPSEPVVVPDILPSTPLKKEPKYHVVSGGETLFSISRKYGITIDDLLKMNKFNQKSDIYAGQKIIVGD
ncbi:MAG: LysM peptidoglycan-binding domain-containing protein [Desulfobacterales bacterium]|nr:LysM peptidoglycan-binding domain-containing protein [Desulfobacterales bacterium]